MMSCSCLKEFLELPGGNEVGSEFARAGFKREGLKGGERSLACYAVQRWNDEACEGKVM